MSLRQAQTDNGLSYVTLSKFILNEAEVSKCLKKFWISMCLRQAQTDNGLNSVTLSKFILSEVVV